MIFKLQQNTENEMSVFKTNNFIRRGSVAQSLSLLHVSTSSTFVTNSITINFLFSTHKKSDFTSYNLQVSSKEGAVHK